MIRNTLHTIAGAAILVPLTLGPDAHANRRAAGCTELGPSSLGHRHDRSDHDPPARRRIGSSAPNIRSARKTTSPTRSAPTASWCGGTADRTAIWLSLYTGDGTRNDDWHSWREPLLAPFDAVVIAIQINPKSTLPRRPRLGTLERHLFQQLVNGEPTDVHVAYVHVREVTVSQGDTVRAGDPVARIGNNGSSFHPHVHVGAFRGDMMPEEAVPLQVRMDLAAMGRWGGVGGAG